MSKAKNRHEEGEVIVDKKTLGIIGGVGPLATMFIGEMIVRKTVAEKDQDHVNMIITNNTNIPDRTAFILDQSNEDPVPLIISDAHRLESTGAEVLAMPCNTAHSFLNRIQAGTDLPVINMIRETVSRAVYNGNQNIGILATTGTIQTGVYQAECKEFGIDYTVSDTYIQSVVMSIIYDDIKAGKPVTREKWTTVEQAMFNAGCDKIILGCTELSLVKHDLLLNGRYIDSLQVLAEAAIESCGYEVKR
ncbi:aspartate/glutamate racemase family protein [Virgibacillus sp. DJP39]|uniref:aspartate/glutamate racemase family protein n=1 Tax=Virgibacillus sp. DJP39 TaxID=3409790 RepID=UPI003BB6DCFA